MQTEKLLEKTTKADQFAHTRKQMSLSCLKKYESECAYTQDILKNWPSLFTSLQLGQFSYVQRRESGYPYNYTCRTNTQHVPTKCELSYLGIVRYKMTGRHGSPGSDVVCDTRKVNLPACQVMNFLILRYTN